MIDIFYRNPDKLPKEKLTRQQRTFLVFAKAFCLGLIDTDATLKEMLQMSADISDHIVDDLIEKIVEVEHA
jgi:hypothetical protein